MSSRSKDFDVAIAGAGPAGTSAAIELAMSGARVLLIEEKKFPREKLCGEFISPECLAHFKRLGVNDQMISTRGASLSQTVFYSLKGRSVAIPSDWFGSGQIALGLSRSEMDHKLLEHARKVGVLVLEGAHAAGLIRENGNVRGVSVKVDDVVSDYRAPVTIDATGRTRALTRYLDNTNGRKRKCPKASRVAFKAHLENVRVAEGVCEIYSYPRGYGGLTRIEGGLSNLCFIVSAEDVRRYGSDPNTVVRKIVKKNPRAAYVLAGAQVRTKWLSVSLESFGRKTSVPASGLLAVGDAAAFNDPFTGSGILMALESGQLVAEIIARHLPELRKGGPLESLMNDYEITYARKFSSRLRVSRMLRRVAFVPPLAEIAILFFSGSGRLRRRFARATRHASERELGTLAR